MGLVFERSVTSYRICSVRITLHPIVHFFSGIEVCKACENGQTKQGCFIRNLICSCGFGCASDYRYDSYQECLNALKVIIIMIIYYRKKREIFAAFTTTHACIMVPAYKFPNIQVTNVDVRVRDSLDFGVIEIDVTRACPVPDAEGRVAGVFPYECIVI
ncbi:hypothetical protein NQ317_011078 [Molorchus minor]|uniref:Uncharacterized protein n=1 Tax=Molorchus minor TaxID=1323400 RepID=A0ABQ9JAH2_9CUCU|nr:hypothetical protein NQ317_011078 [Molorchus minor]